MESFLNEFKSLVFAILDYFFQPSIKEKETEEEVRHKKKKRLHKINKTKNFLKKIKKFKK